MAPLKQGSALSAVLDEYVLREGQDDKGKKVNLSREEQKRVEEVFNDYAYDGSGKIAKGEIRNLLVDLKWSVDQNHLQDLMENASFGQELDLEMFVKLYKAVVAKQPTSVRKQQSAKDGEKARAAARISIGDLRLLEADLRCLFKEMDEEKKGYLSIVNMREVLRRSGLPDPDGDQFETAVHEHMRVADVSKDGKVSFEEFIGYRNMMIEYCQACGLIETPGGAGVEEDPEASSKFRFLD